MKTHSHITTANYLFGFILSLVLTITAYVVVVNHILPSEILIFVIAGLAIVQFVVQMIYFLHLGFGEDSRDRFLVLGFAGVIVTILVVGSLWIMNNLNQRMMPTQQQMDQYMNDQTGI